MKKYVFTLISLLFVSLLDEAEAQGNFVFNGGFDFNASVWVTSNVPSDGYRSTKGNPGGFFTLDTAPSSSTDPTISQAINGLIPSTSYIISGDYQLSIDRGGGSPTDPSFGVAIDGLLLFEAVAPSDFNWHSFNFIYTASSSSELLSLSSQRNGTGFSYGIDNIAMQVVPEPSSLCLMGAGGIVWAMVFKNRRKGFL